MAGRSRWFVGSSSKQDVGLRRQRLRERRATPLPAGQRRGLFLTGQPELLQQIAGTIRIVARSEPRLHIGERVLERAEIRLLREVADCRARLHEARAAIRLRRGPRRSSAASICRSRCGPTRQARSPGAIVSSALWMRGVPPNVRATSWSVRSGGAAICASVTPPAGGCKVDRSRPRVDACRSLWSLSGPSAGPSHDAYETPAPPGADLGSAGDHDLDVHGGVASSRPRGGSHRSGDPSGAPRGLRAGADLRRRSRACLLAVDETMSIRTFRYPPLQYLPAVPAAQSALSHFHRGAGCQRSGEAARPANRPAEEARFADRPYFKASLASQGFAVGEFTPQFSEGGLDVQPVLPLSLPIWDDDGQMIGLVVAALDLKWLDAEAAGAGPADRRIGDDRRSQRRDHCARAPPRAVRRNPHPRTVHEICSWRQHRLVRDPEPGRRSANSRLHSGEGVPGRHLRQRRFFFQSRLSAPSTALPIAVS